MDLNVLVRGQSNAQRFVGYGGAAVLEQGLEARLPGVDIHMLYQADADPGTIWSATAFMDWDTDGQQASLLRYVRGLSADLKDNPTAVLWMHNEYDQMDAGLTTDAWLGEVRADAALVRGALGQGAGTTPYTFVPIRYPWGDNWETIGKGMAALDADPAFNASISWAAWSLAMDDDDGRPNGGHMGEADAVLLGESLVEGMAGTLRPLANGSAPADAVPVRGTDGDDVFAGRPGVFAYEGLQGRDVLDWSGIGFRGVVVAAQADGGVRLTHGNDVASVRGVEEVRFADGRLVLDAADPAAKVARLYEAALDRLPDQSGMNFWTAAVQNGEPLSSLASGFLSAPEFTARFGDIADDGAFVDRLYLNVLGRAGEADGRKFWVDSLGGGATRAEVLAAFSESQENQAGTAALVQNGIWDRSEAAAEVARLYDTVFGRKADIQGLTFWKGALEDGAATLGQMADAFTGSAEFRAQYGNLGNRGFADALYVNSLDRPADQAGLDFWTGRLDAGVARSAVVLAFSESAEHIALTAPGIGGEARGEYGILFA